MVLMFFEAYSITYLIEFVGGTLSKNKSKSCRSKAYFSHLESLPLLAFSVTHPHFVTVLPDSLCSAEGARPGLSLKKRQ